MKTRKKAEQTEGDTRTQHMRFVTLGLGRNLAQVRWAWEHPAKAYDHVSVPMQLVMTLLAVVALCPLEEMVYDTAEDTLTTRRKDALLVADLSPDNPDGFLANLPHWRRAVAEGRVEMYMTEDGLRLAGLRAWRPPGETGPAWTMALDIERLSALVHCLMRILPGWGLPPLSVTLPPNVR